MQPQEPTPMDPFAAAIFAKRLGELASREPDKSPQRNRHERRAAAAQARKGKRKVA